MTLTPESNNTLRVAIEPTVISVGQSFTLTVQHADGTPYTGYLDHDQVFCPLGVTNFERCIVRHGPWETFFINDGTLTVNIDDAPVRGGRLTDGMYIARFRPRDSEGRYSNQIGYVIDRAARPVSETTENNDGRYIVPQPVSGAYVVYRDMASDGQFNGYTKIEFEGGACETDGVIQRFTKTASTAYWSPSAEPADQVISAFRWCIGSSPSNSQNYKALTGYMTRFDRTQSEQSALAHTRYGEKHVGNLGRLGSNVVKNSFVGPSPLFYTLAPVQLFPEQLSEEFTPIIDRLVKYDADAGVFNNWHVEVRASQLGGMYEVRYVEWALGVANLSAQPAFAATPSVKAADWGMFFRWNIYEDWDWNADGTLNRLTQVGNTRRHHSIGPDDLPTDCWRVPNGCDRPIRHELSPLHRYVPDRRAQLLHWAVTNFPGWNLDRLLAYVTANFAGLAFAPLHLGFVNAAGDEVTEHEIAPDERWTLRVLTADDEPYDGFLQLRDDSGPPQVWADARGYAICVHNGQVELLPGAFRFAAGTTITLEMRQQLLNEQIAADIALKNRAQPNNDDMPFSNRIQLMVKGKDQIV